METAEYVEREMSHVPSVDTYTKVHDFAISETEADWHNSLILEFGVFQGKTINYIAKNFPNRIIDGFDSFEGLPEFWRDGFSAGAFSMSELPRVEANVRLHKGWFNNTIPTYLDSITPGQDICYLHIDCDLYSSTKSVLKLLGDRIKPGTVIVFDEYFNYPGWKGGEIKAFQEFIAYSGLGYRHITYKRLHEQVAVKII